MLCINGFKRNSPVKECAGIPAHAYAPPSSSFNFLVYHKSELILFFKHHSLSFAALSKTSRKTKGEFSNRKKSFNFISLTFSPLTFKTDIVIGGGLNVYNNITANLYGMPIIVSEGKIATKVNFPYMTLRHCPLKNHLGANCANCPYTNYYTLKMENGKEFKLKRLKLSSCTFYLTD